MNACIDCEIGTYSSGMVKGCHALANRLGGLASQYGDAVLAAFHDNGHSWAGLNFEAPAEEKPPSGARFPHITVDVGERLAVDDWAGMIGKVSAALRAAGVDAATLKEFHRDATQGNTFMAITRWVNVTTTEGRRDPDSRDGRVDRALEAYAPITVGGAFVVNRGES